jgi:putative membrane protein insertion efficiency factor
MKKIVIGTITLYQRVISPFLRQILGMPVICRYSPSCSEYAKIVIYKHGIVKGGIMAMKRLLSCRPSIQPKKQILKQ